MNVEMHENISNDHHEPDKCWKEKAMSMFSNPTTTKSHFFIFCDFGKKTLDHPFICEFEKLQKDFFFACRIRKFCILLKSTKKICFEFFRNHIFFKILKTWKIKTTKNRHTRLETLFRHHKLSRLMCKSDDCENWNFCCLVCLGEILINHQN